MILVLCENTGAQQEAGRRITQHLQSAYQLPAPPELVGTDTVWQRSPEWDDLLIVVYGSAPLPKAAQDYIAAYCTAHGPGAFVIPVALDAAHMQPPPPISGIKAALFGKDAQSLGKIEAEIGERLGLALRPGRRRIFISYRQSDGKDIARDLHGRLRSDGFDPWLDEADENLHSGDYVQTTILDRIKDAAMVLVVDTRDAPDSSWLFYEIEMAIAQLVLILPVVVGHATSRFDPLASLQRRALVKPGGADGTPLSDAEWSTVRAEMDQLLLSSYQRRLALMSRAQRDFESRNYNWSALDHGLRMYKAHREQGADSALRMPLSVLSHCLIHEITWVPALKAYRDYIDGLSERAHFNYRLCLYNRERKLSEAERRYIYRELGTDSVYPIHSDQLPISLATNFARVD